MRVGYAVMGIGLALVKWPLFVTHPEPWPLFEGVVTCILTAMSLLAFLGFAVSDSVAANPAVRVCLEAHLVCVLPQIRWDRTTEKRHHDRLDRSN